MSADHTDERFGCDKCWPPSADDARKASDALGRGARLVDDSHLGVTMRSCAHCRQQFVAVFAEVVDWQDGDDSQYWSLLPVTQGEAKALTELNESQAIAYLNGLPKQRRCLQDDHPKGKPRRVAWGRGLMIAA